MQYPRSSIAQSSPRSCKTLKYCRFIRITFDIIKGILCILILYESFIFNPLYTSASLQVRKPPSSQNRCVGTCNAGVCLDGTCVCSPGWTGAQCDICYGRIRKKGTTSGYITDGPVDYNPQSKCIWIIENENAQSPLLLKFEEFFTECCWDTLYIYDGDGVYNTLIGAFSGDLTGREVVVSSGRAIVYFVSDLAFNLPGFNISFEYGRCAHNCSGRGRCLSSGICKCERGYVGKYCQQAVCLTEMNGYIGPCRHHTSCQDGRCACNKHTHGNYCQELTLNPVWDTVIVTGDAEEFQPRASHTLTLINKEIWLFGGVLFDNVMHKKSDKLLFFDINNSEWHTVNVKGAVAPSARYDHSMIYYDKMLYVFGGVIGDGTITNELWCFHMSDYKWTLLNPHTDIPLRVPIAVAGHTAHIIDNEMYIFFGYNPYEEYVHRVQIYSFATGKWRKGDVDPFIMGRFGHSSTVYRESDKHSMVLVYGGFSAVSNTYSYALSDQLLLYDVSRQTWTNLGETSMALYRHSAVILNGIMYIIGGNAHNETSKARQNNCYSNLLLAYDISCREWLRVSLRESANLPSRYGHAAVADDKNMYILGGFDGMMLNDVLRFTPADCDAQAKSVEECETSSNGIRCVFINRLCQRAALDTSYRQPFLSFIKTENPRLQADCTSRRTQLVACVEIKECSDCVHAGCGWCDGTQTCLNSDTACVDGLLTDRKSCPLGGKGAKHGDKTTHERLRGCATASNCFACRQLRHCTWLSMGVKQICVSLEDEALLIAEHNKLESERIASLNVLLIGSSSLANNYTPTVPSGSNISTSSSYKSSLLSPISGKVGSRYFPNIHNDIIVFPLEIDGDVQENATCPAPCFLYTSCQTCIQAQCTWCQSTKRCISSDAQLIHFPYGQCQSWVTATQNACHLDPYDCELQRTCSDCQFVGPRCGWCDDGSGTGLGRCVAGTSAGPLEIGSCSPDHWYFTGEPTCQCNGHSTCTLNATSMATRRKCRACSNRTRGEHCEQCENGFYGDPRNGGVCRECQCNGQATHCNAENGDCYCFTKGVTGPHCDKCEPKYEGDPANGRTCIYQLLIDFIFTFKFDDDNLKDKYVSRVNFYSVPPKRDTDVQLTITCESDSTAKVFVNLSTIVLEGRPPHTKQLMAGQLCTSAGIKRTYSATDPGYAFGTEANTTFHVRVTDFVTPMKIVISFAQSPPINWVLFFIIFAACFIVLLVVAGILWMIKLRIEWYRNIRRLHEEIEEMASRPFASVQLQWGDSKTSAMQCAAITSENGPDTTTLMPTPVAIEPCGNYQAGVYTIIIRLPTGGRSYTPYGTSGLAVGSALCQLTHAQLALLQPPSDNLTNNGGVARDRKSVLRRYIPFIRSNGGQ